MAVEVFLDPHGNVVITVTNMFAMSADEVQQAINVMVDVLPKKDKTLWVIGRKIQSNYPPNFE